MFENLTSKRELCLFLILLYCPLFLVLLQRWLFYGWF